MAERKDQQPKESPNETPEETRRGQGFIEGKGGEPTEAQRALRRLLVILAIVMGMGIYAYGWTVTDIDLDRPQEEKRQKNVTRALRELLSPDLFDQDRELSDLETSILLVEDKSTCADADIPQQGDQDDEGQGVVVVEPACVASDEEVVVRVTGASENAEARVRWLPPTEEGEEPRPRPREIIETGREEIVLDSNGGFRGTIEVPRIRGGEGQIHTVQFRIAVPTGPIRLSTTSHRVLDRIAETIFMALVATTVAIPIAAALSFFAARNLMQQMRMSLGGALLAFVTFAIGVVLGGELLSPVGKAAGELGRGEFEEFLDRFDWLERLFAVGMLIIAGMLSSFRQRVRNVFANDKTSDPAVARGWLVAINAVLVTLGLVVLIGLVGGLATLIGAEVMDFGESFKPQSVDNLADRLVNGISDLVSSMGRLLEIIGTVIDLSISVIAAALAGFALATVAGSLLGRVLRRVPIVPDHVLGAAFGAVGGGTLLLITAQAALWASLFGLLPLFTASVLGGVLLVQIVRTGVKLSGRKWLLRELLGQSARARVIRPAIFGAGALLVGLFVFAQLNIGRTLVDGTLPTQTQQEVFDRTLPITIYEFEAVIIGAVLAGIAGALVGVRTVFPIGSVVYSISRLTMNIVRSIEPLIMGLVFVIWVGIGPFAGVLALTLHSIAALGKLYSEQVESIDPGPVEGLRATGANHLQTIIYAVVPQIIPPYIAFTMYRWDINVRMSTIIGFVGGGGIGLLLQQQINLLRYRQAGVAVLAIAVVVSALDYASALIRERVT